MTSATVDKPNSPRRSGGLHPATWLICWVAFLFLVARFSLYPLVAVCLALWFAARTGAVAVGPALRRMRWVLVSGLLIYAFATPGAPLWFGLGHGLGPGTEAFAPTIEGLISGALQLLRLIAAVLSLTLLMAKLQPTGVLTALDSLLAPLRWLGRNPERLIARLWLTLHYVQPRREAPFSAILQDLRLPLSRNEDSAARNEDLVVTLERRPLRCVDAVVLLACMATISLSLL